jgi:hypothetical protein
MWARSKAVAPKRSSRAVRSAPNAERKRPPEDVTSPPSSVSTMCPMATKRIGNRACTSVVLWIGQACHSGAMARPHKSCRRNAPTDTCVAVLHRRKERAERRTTHIAELRQRAAEAETKHRRLYDAIETESLTCPIRCSRIAWPS